MLRHLLVYTASAIALLAASPEPSRAAAIAFDFEGLALGAQTPLSVGSAGLTAVFAGPAGVDPDAFALSYNSSSGPFPAPYRTLQVAFLTTGGRSAHPAARSRSISARRCSPSGSRSRWTPRLVRRRSAS